MNAVQTQWNNQLEALRVRTASDFCAAAHFDASTRRIRWIAASGNTNERFLRMVKKPGEGIAGEAVRFGRLIQRNYASELELRTDDYILMAERLLVAAAVPVGYEPSNPQGILLIGRRASNAYEQRDIDALWEAARTLELNAGMLA